MIAGGPQWARSATRRSRRSWRPRGDRLGPPGDRWPFPAYLSGQPSPSAVLDDALAPIASLDGELSSFIAIDADRAHRGRRGRRRRS
jgi:hypothetical protein